MLTKQTKKAEIGPGRIRYRVVITGEECIPETMESRVRQEIFMRELADTPALLHCGYHVFQKLIVKHNGICWQAEAEAEVDEETS